MPTTATTQSIPGIFPLIAHINPSLKGADNFGHGFTQHNEQFVLKKGGQVGAAEFVGASVCGALGIPACQPTIVTVEKFGQQLDVFGSRIESGVHDFNQTDLSQWKDVLSQCCNTDAFSALLAVDLVLGNDDRHWNNWLVQTSKDRNGVDCYRLRAMDFSRSWPTAHPAQHPLQHRSPNTWQATKYWELLGVTFDPIVFYTHCAKISALSTTWLRRQVMQQIVGIFLTPDEVDQYCAWWEQHLQDQVIEAIHSLENGVRP